MKTSARITSLQEKVEPGTSSIHRNANDPADISSYKYASYNEFILSTLYTVLTLLVTSIFLHATCIFSFLFVLKLQTRDFSGGREGGEEGF